MTLEPHLGSPVIVSALACEKGGVTLRPRDCVSLKRPMVVNDVLATGIEPDPAGKDDQAQPAGCLGVLTTTPPLLASTLQ